MLERGSTMKYGSDYPECDFCTRNPDMGLTCIDNDAGQHTHGIECDGCQECDGCEFDCHANERIDPRCKKHGELVRESMPRWNCVDFPGEGMHYLNKASGCRWCGKTKEELALARSV